MADRMISKHQRAAMMAASALYVVSGLAAAQALNDPTRPPAMIYADTPGEAGAAGAPILQSVKISPTERLAIIGGESVKLGGRYGDARVVKITEQEVVLRSPSGSETLRMYPGVNIKPILSEPAARKKRTPGRSAARKRTTAPRPKENGNE